MSVSEGLGGVGCIGVGFSHAQRTPQPPLPVNLPEPLWWPPSPPTPLPFTSQTRQKAPFTTPVCACVLLQNRQLAILHGHFGCVNDIAWSEDGLYLVSVSEGEVYTWHMETFTRCEKVWREA